MITKLVAVACLSFMATSVFASIDQKPIDEAIASRDRGEFEKATLMLQDVLEQSSATATADERRQVEFEIEKIRRIRQDYTVSREELLKAIRDRVADFTEEELDAYERDGKLDVLNIDGRKLYVKSSRSNLFKRESALLKRWAGAPQDTSLQMLYAHMEDVKKAAAETKDYLVLPQDFRVSYSLVVDANAVPEGEIVRAWLPFMRAIPSQSDSKILSADPPIKHLAQPQADHRTAYFERPSVKDQPTTFQLSFIYRCWARAYPLDPAAVKPYRKDDPDYALYSAERKPHIDFSNDELKKISASLKADGQDNPLILARRIYDWVADNCIYQYAREYSTIDNLSGYTAVRRAGDCGQHGMLFIALCRMNGIPARWATGWESFEANNGNNMHDWSEFYVEPYGWVPADADMAVIIKQHGNDALDTTQTAQLADWLFGNMDHFRLTVNGDFSRELDPSKDDFRSETVDFQRGEVEAKGQNLYFDKGSYDMDIQPVARAEAEKLLAPPQSKPKAAPAAPEPPTTATATNAVQTSAPTQ